MSEDRAQPPIPPGPAPQVGGNPCGRAESADLDRELVRTADRLRLVAPRLAARPGAQPREILELARRTVQTLADLAADAWGDPRRPVPALDVRALADQLLVMGHELLDAGVEQPALRAAAAQSLIELRRRM